MSDTTILRRTQVSHRTKLSRSNIYLKMSRGEFPTPVSLGARAVGWLESEVEAWLQARIAASREGAPPVAKAAPAALDSGCFGVAPPPGTVLAAPILPGRRIEGGKIK
jgi:prophage regulatory protein